MREVEILAHKSGVALPDGSPERLMSAIEAYLGAIPHVVEGSTEHEIRTFDGVFRTPGHVEVIARDQEQPQGLASPSRPLRAFNRGRRPPRA
jgi:hypothetical protein